MSPLPGSGDRYFNLSWYDLELDFLAHVSLALQHHVYEAKDRFLLRDLTVLVQGSAPRTTSTPDSPPARMPTIAATHTHAYLCAAACLGLRIMIKGSVLGLECVMKPEHHGLIDPTKIFCACLTFTEVQCVSREVIFAIAADFPKAHKHMIWAVRRVTFRACVHRASAQPRVPKNRGLNNMVGWE